MDYQLWRIYWAFRIGDSDLATDLLSMDTNNQVESIIKGFYGDTLLHLACQNGWVDYVKFLIEVLGCDPEIKDCGNQTPLHYACHYGHLDIVQYLTEVCNCDVAVATRDHWTPLHYVCRYGHKNIVEYILDIPEVTNRSQLQCVACKYNHNGNFEKLTEIQGSPAIMEPLSILLLQIACIFNQIQIVQLLCSKYSSHRHLNDTEIRRLFMFCFKHGLLETMKQLRCDVTHHVDTQRKSGLHYACQGGHISIAKHLVEECGCDIDKKDKMAVPHYN